MFRKTTGTPRPEIQRPDENFEPYEEHSGIPMPVLWIAIALGLWGGLVLLDTREATSVAQEERVDQVVDEQVTAHDDGRAVFAAKCATCHQPDGLGVRGAVPPLVGSAFVAHGPQIVAQILLRGIDGPIAVAGQTYDGHMPSFASALSDMEIAQVASFVTRKWGGAEGALPEAEVTPLREAAAGRQSWQGGAELATIIAGLPAQPAAGSRTVGQVPQAVSELVFAGRGEVWACASCHGDLGQGAETTPRLAGLPAAYIVKQLQDFRQGHRISESMAIVAAGLAPEEMAGLGAYYAALRVPSTATATLGADLARGEALALQGDWSLKVPACFSCHGPSGFGLAPVFPALAAQHAAYTASQLNAWAGGQRKNATLDLMTHISTALSPQDRRAVADYMALLPPVPARTDPQAARNMEQDNGTQP
ncbi:c-type cytochrome [Paracoccaceae bacterium Fryx2]|nr:c-type cytochrome [Paracoccaceae bacterium Fryx2]